MSEHAIDHIDWCHVNSQSKEFPEHHSTLKHHSQRSTPADEDGSNHHVAAQITSEHNDDRNTVVTTGTDHAAAVVTGGDSASQPLIGSIVPDATGGRNRNRISCRLCNNTRPWSEQPA